MSGETGSGYVRANKRLITQSRSECVGVLVATQMLSELDESVKSNAATVMCFGCPNPRDAQQALLMLGLGETDMRQIMTLPMRRAFVRSEGFSGSVLVDVPYLLLGDYPSAADIARRMRPALAKLDEETIFSDGNETIPIPTAAMPGEPAGSPAPAGGAAMDDRALSPDEQALFDQVQAAPLLGTTENYRRLAWAFRRGDRAKKRLLARRLIRVERQESRNGRPKEILMVVPSA